MIICQVDASVSAMGKEGLEQELRLLEDVLNALEGELICAEGRMGGPGFVAYVRAESELAASDIFEACGFAVEQIAYLGPSHDAHIDCNRPTGQLTWQYRPAQASVPQADARATPPRPPALRAGQKPGLSAP
jgi:hypothetical protein